MVAYQVNLVHLRVGEALTETEHLPDGLGVCLVLSGGDHDLAQLRPAG